MNNVVEAGTARQAAILDAATTVFLRYGFKKTSMDDLARAVGISRQALYLHFQNKEALFRATVLHTTEAMCAAARAALAREDLELEERVLGAYEAIHASTIGVEHLDELLATTAALTGPAYYAVENTAVAEVARTLSDSGVGARWKELGASAEDLAAQLLATSDGIKERVSTRAEYRERMRIAIRMICRGALQRERGSSK
jgi:AcrR family transcriptional regulator